jgi:hypothetical protein
MSEAAYQFLSFSCKGIIVVLAILGFLYTWTEVSGTAPVAETQAEFKSIILDDARLVRCRTIDRSQPSCTLLKDCDDEVERCVITYEVIHRSLGPADHLPLDTAD